MFRQSVNMSLSMLNKIKFSAVFLFFLLCVTAFSQVGEYRNTLSLGANGGMTFNTISFDPHIKQNSHIGPTFGVTMRYTCEKYFKTLCALQLELNYTRLGWTEHVLDHNSEELPDEYSRHLDYIQLPMLARLSWGREKGVMFSIMAGPQLGYCFGETSKRSEVWTVTADGLPDRPNMLSAQYDMELDHKLDYGITGGLGIDVNTKIGRFSIEGRYYYGLADIFASAKKDVFSKSNHQTISAKISYLIDIK